MKVFTPVLKEILSSIEEFHRLRSDICPTDIVVTSINDSQHSEHSKHYTNEAIDIRSKNFEPWKKQIFVTEFSKYLNLDSPTKYTVLLESLNTTNEHFHVQLAKGTVYNG